MVYFVFDSSSIISIAETCLIDVFGKLAEETKVRFVIPAHVEDETVTRPLQIKRFELNALRIKKTIDSGWIEVKGLGFAAKQQTKKIMQTANQIFYSKKKPIKLIQRGEAETLALINELRATTLVIDERTTRMLIEDPYLLKDFMEERYGERIDVNKTNLRRFSRLFPKINVIRSVELIAFAFEKRLLEEEIGFSKKALQAALYAVKFRGCAVSSSEIESFLKGF